MSLTDQTSISWRRNGWRLRREWTASGWHAKRADTDHCHHQPVKCMILRTHESIPYPTCSSIRAILHNFVMFKILNPYKLLQKHWANVNMLNCKNNEKALRETQTLRAGCSKAEPKKFALPQTPFPGARDCQNLISWRWLLPLPTNPVWWGSMHEFRVIVVTDPQTNKHTNPQTRPITIHCAAAS